MTGGVNLTLHFQLGLTKNNSIPKSCPEICDQYLSNQFDENHRKETFQSLGIFFERASSPGWCV